MNATRQTSRVIGVGLIFVVIAGGGLITPWNSNEAVVEAAVGSVSGTVFRDFNSNGARDTVVQSNVAYDYGVGGVTVTAFDDTGTAVASTPTAADGTYTLNYSTAGTSTKVRVEFTPPPLDGPWHDSFSGGTSVQFAESGAVINYAIHQDRDYSNPLTSQIVVPVSSRADTHSLYQYRYGTTERKLLATKAQLGTVWGSATYGGKYVFTAAFLKYKGGFPVGVTNPLAQIYITDATASATNGAAWGTVPAVTNTGAAPSTQYSSRIHTEGLGDLDISVDQSTLYVMNLETRSIQPIVVTPPAVAGGPPTMGAAGAPITVPTSLPNASQACDDAFTQPFGMDVTSQEIFVGITCWGRDTQVPLNLDTDFQTYDNDAVQGYIYRYDLQTNTWDGTPALEIDFSNYFWGGPNISVNYGINYREWQETDPARSDYSTVPTIMDLTVDPVTKNMTVNVGSRTSDMIEHNQTGGDILLACPSNAAATQFTLESNGVCGGVTSGVVQGSAGNNNADGLADDHVYTKDEFGPGSGEFFNDNYSTNPQSGHTENGLGSTEQIPGLPSLAAGQMDPTGALHQNGIRYLGTSQWSDPGDTVFSVNVTSTALKGQGLGELSVLLDLAPIEIGNRVWIDADRDGVQDASEAPVAGVTVQLFNAANVLVGTAKTNAVGEYYFRSNVTEAPAGTGDHIGGGVTASKQFRVVIPASNFSGSGALLDQVATTALQGETQRDSNGTENATGGVEATVTTGAAGVNDHTIDFGFRKRSVEMTKTQTGLVGPDSDGTYQAQYTIVVTNPSSHSIEYSLHDQPQFGAGTVIVDHVTVSGPPFTPDPLLVSGADAADGFDIVAVGSEQTIAAAATHTYKVTVPFIIDGAPLTVASSDCVSDSASETGTGTLNTATVTADGTKLSDDDCREVKVADLALIKTLSDGQPFVHKDGTVEAEFDITVTNQGTAVAENVDVVDYYSLNNMEIGSFQATSTAGVVGATPTISDNGSSFMVDRLDPGETITVQYSVGYPAGQWPSTIYNVAEIRRFLTPEISTDPSVAGADIDSTPDSEPANDALVDGDTSTDGVNVESDSNNIFNWDEDGDGSLNDRNASDEDDHDGQTIRIPSDLALRKTVTSNDIPLNPGTSTVTFSIDVFNQSSGPAPDRIVLTDYIDSTMFECAVPQNGGTLTAFDAATGDPATVNGAITYSWVAGSSTCRPQAEIDITGGTLAPGTFVRVPITLKVAGAWNSSMLDNTAEILSFSKGANALTDIDSIPDETVNNDTLVDDVTDNTDDDEDDHDIAQLPIYDVALIKTLSPGQDFVADITTNPVVASFDITVKNQGNRPIGEMVIEDTLPAGSTYHAHAGDVAYDSSSPSGIARFALANDLAAGATYTFSVTLKLDPSVTKFVNSAEVTSIQDASGATVIDVDSDDVTLGDQGKHLDGDTANDGVNDPKDGTNKIDYTNPTTNPNGNLNIPNGDDEDDSDSQVVVINADLALRKTFVSTDDPLASTRTVHFSIEVFNQGRTPVSEIILTDYVDSDVWEAFDLADNTDGTTEPAVAPGYTSPATPLGYSWDNSAPYKPTVTLTGVLAPNESAIVPVTLTVVSDYKFVFPSVALVNLAEISSMLGPDGNPVGDIDSTPDGVNDDVLDDNKINLTRATGDEDDHDIALVPPVYDMSLIKTLSAGQSFIVDPVASSQVLFDISVMNQGTEPMLDVVVTDYVPDGLDYAGIVYDGLHTITATEVVGGDEQWAFTIDAYDSSTALNDALTIKANEIVTFTVVFDLVSPFSPNLYSNDAEVSAMSAVRNQGGVKTYVPNVADIDSAPDTSNGNDLRIEGDTKKDGINVASDSHNEIRYDPDRDGNVGELTPGDEDDQDRQSVRLSADLALRKTVADVGAVATGEPVTFNIEVFNQGKIPVDSVVLTDHIDLKMWEEFAGAPDTTVTSGHGVKLNVQYGTGAEPKISVDPVADADVIAPGDTFTVPITLTIADGYVLADGPLRNLAEISGPYDDSDSTPDDVSDNDVEADDVIDNAKNDEDDADPAYVYVADLALRKIINETKTEFPIEPDSTVTFDIEVFNQGNVAADSIEITEYVDVELWEAFDSTLNPNGTTTGDQTLSYVWTSNVVALNGVLPAGESVVFPVTLRISSEATLETELVNTAEILTMRPLNQKGVGIDVSDVDSVPDGDIGNDVLVDDVIDNADDDEDDHDIAKVDMTLYALGNKVWFDINNNGLIDPAEQPVSGVTVQLYKVGVDGTEPVLVKKTVTDAQGLYLFDELERGNYTVSIPRSNFAKGAVLSGWHSSTPTESDPETGVDNNDNGELFDNEIRSGLIKLDGNSPVGETPNNASLVRDDRASDLTIDFGFYQLSLGNELWFDTDRDGQIDKGERPVVGATVELFRDVDLDGVADGPAIAVTATDSNGHYLFPGLAEGSYLVGIPASNFATGRPLGGYLSTGPTAGAPNNDVDNDDNGIATKYGVLSGTVALQANTEPVGETLSNEVVVADASSNLTVDFGFVLPIPTTTAPPTSSAVTTTTQPTITDLTTVDFRFDRGVGTTIPRTGSDITTGIALGFGALVMGLVLRTSARRSKLE